MLIKRRHLLATTAGSAAGIYFLGKSVVAAQPTAKLSDLYTVTLNDEIQLAVALSDRDVPPRHKDAKTDENICLYEPRRVKE